MIYKRLLCLLLVLSAALSMFACSLKESGNVPDQEKSSVSSEQKAKKQLTIEEAKENAVRDLSKSFMDVCDILQHQLGVVLISKENLDSNQGKYFEFEYAVKNNTEKSILAIEGATAFYDMDGNMINVLSCNFTEEVIPVGKTIRITKTEINYEMDLSENLSATKLHETNFDELKAEFKPVCIVFTDGTMVCY